MFSVLLYSVAICLCIVPGSFGDNSYCPIQKYSLPHDRTQLDSNFEFLNKNNSENASVLVCGDGSDHKSQKIDELTERVDQLTERPIDCSDILADGDSKSQVYEIYPQRRYSTPVKVFCDMDGGGWTVFLNRAMQQIPQDFNQNWIEYKTGFGSPSPGHENWLGNENLHRLTRFRNYTVRLEASKPYGDEPLHIWGEWNTFKVGSESEKYKLTVGNYNGKSSALDVLFSDHNGQPFSTFDHDNDNDTVINCAETGGGWWHTKCYTMQPTGLDSSQDNTGKEFSVWADAKKTGEMHYAGDIQLKIKPYY